MSELLYCCYCERACAPDEIEITELQQLVVHRLCATTVYQQDALLRCAVCVRLCSPEEVVRGQHGEEIHDACGCVLLPCDSGLDLSLVPPSASALDAAIQQQCKRKKRTPPIRARPTRGRSALYRLPTLRSSAGGYERPYHLNERLSQRQNIEVPLLAC